MSLRRRPIRDRDIVSFARRTPRCNFQEIHDEIRTTSNFLRICNEEERWQKNLALRFEHKLPKKLQNSDITL